MYLNLEQIKKHLNIDSYFTEDDDYLMMLANVAENTVAKHIDCNLSDLCDNSGDLEPPLIHAMLLLIGSMYMQRESVTYSTITEVPHSYNYLLDLYKDYSKKNDNGGTF